MLPIVGHVVSDHSAARSVHVILEGRHGRLRPLHLSRDTARRYALSHGEEREALWAYLFTGPSTDPQDFEAHVTTIACSTIDPVCRAIADRNDDAVGWLSLMRFGFSYEGRFRQHMIVKGRNRDTTWLAMLDHEWPEKKAAYERWLAPQNFDENEQQLARLGEA